MESLYLDVEARCRMGFESVTSTQTPAAWRETGITVESCKTVSSLTVVRF